MRASEESLCADFIIHLIFKILSRFKITFKYPLKANKIVCLDSVCFNMNTSLSEDRS